MPSFAIRYRVIPAAAALIAWVALVISSRSGVGSALLDAGSGTCH